jgi:glutathionylspermidine synthase
MMVTLHPTEPLTTTYLEQLGFVWHTDKDQTPYLSDTLVVITKQEAEAYEAAANELYEMFIEAGEYVVANNLFHEIGIPFNLIDLIKQSWEHDVHWHLYGRFDLAGGIGGAPIKLLEFNADTPTALFETAIIQWAILKQNGLDETWQFNALYESLLENFKRLVTLEEETESFAAHYEGWGFLFSSIRGNAEEEQTVRLLKHIATEAGYKTAFAYIDEIEFDGQEGIFWQGERYELWFKLTPWEMIALEESDLAMLLKQIILNQKAILFNPAYTLMFQSKAILKILSDLYPDHPLLLPCSFKPLAGVKQVEKPIFGREGGSVSILDANGKRLLSIPSEYENHRMVYQAYTPLVQDSSGARYQAGVFYAYEACALGFRKGGEILDNRSKFVGHLVRDT